MLNKIICPGTPDPIKTRQQAAWSSGDYALIGVTIQIVGETICEAMDLRGGQRVLDVAAGNGNAALAAARRWCEVVATDYVPALLERAHERARAERLDLQIDVADAEALPYDDGSFDAVVSVFGAMFTPNHQKTAGEMQRVCRPGGKIGLACWTPAGFIGEVFKIIGKFAPPPPGMTSPLLWGTEAHISELFGQSAKEIRTEVKHLVFRYRSDDHWIEIFKTYYGPMVKTFESLEPDRRDALIAELKAVIARFNVARDGTMVVPSAYLEIVVTKT